MKNKTETQDQVNIDNEAQMRGFLMTLCSVYFAFLLVVLPLYVGRGYDNLGDTKYQLFRNVSLICEGLFVAVGGALLVKDISGKRKTVGRDSTISTAAQPRVRKAAMLPSVCYWVLAYGVWNLVSALCSKFQPIAWSGYEEWYMGALTQCLLVGIYLMALWFGQQSEKKPFSMQMLTILSMGTLGIITLIGLLQMLDPDVLGLLTDYGATDWVRGHMLSTLGNTNWLCGCYSVLYAWSLSLYLQGKKKLPTVLSGVLNAAVTVLLLIQGSDGGLLLVAAAVLIGLLLSCFHNTCGRAQFGKLLLLGMRSSFLLILWKILAKVCQTVDIMFQDGYAKAILFWKGWPMVACGLFFIWLVYRKLSSDQSLILRRCLLVLVGVLYLVAAVSLLWNMRKIPFSQWGNYRGSLWQMACVGFLQGNWVQKLVGAGPDCFALYLNQISPETTVLFHTGHFAGSVFTNAHNEWLTLLINIGVPGVVCYAGVFISALRRYWGKPLAMFLLGLYVIYSLVSFQQVLNAPLFFLALGLCEMDHVKTNNLFESIAK